MALCFSLDKLLLCEDGYSVVDVCCGCSKLVFEWVNIVLKRMMKVVAGLMNFD